MSDDKELVKSKIREFFMEKAKRLEEQSYLQGKTPTDLLGIIRFDDGTCQIIVSKDSIITLGLMEELKNTMKNAC